MDKKWTQVGLKYVNQMFNDGIYLKTLDKMSKNNRGKGCYGYFTREIERNLFLVDDQAISAISEYIFV